MYDDIEHLLIALMLLRERYGTLNRALVALYVEVHGCGMGQREIARKLGLSRTVVREYMQGWSEKDHE